MTNVPAQSSTRPAIFAAVLIFVGGVSAFDGYLVLRTGEMIRDFEQNPVGRYLINCDDGDPGLFLGVKATGTVLALTALTLLRKRSRRLADRVALGLVCFQSGLLIFLESN
jgi:hypothetical protein